LPTRFFLSKKWDIEESSCPFCSSQPETSDHLFFGCPFAVITWSLSPWPLNPTNMNDQPIHEWIRKIIYPSTFLQVPKKDEQKFILFAIILFDKIWW
jgi:hypothetical protein